MSRYRVLIAGENITMNVDGVVRNVGFYATRIVDAHDIERAQLICIEDIKSEIAVRCGGIISDKTIVKLEEITPVSWAVGRLNPPKGFTFFIEEPE